VTVVLACVAWLLAGCGGGEKSNRKAAYTPPPTTAPASGNANQQDAEAKAAARTLVTAVEACFVDQQDYSACKKPSGASVTIGSGPGQVEVASAATATYSVVAHSKSGTAFKVEKGSDGSSSRSCDKPGDGGCPSGGTW
jgi:hypothetical protein